SLRPGRGATSPGIEITQPEHIGALPANRVAQALIRSHQGTGVTDRQGDVEAVVEASAQAARDLPSGIAESLRRRDTKREAPDLLENPAGLFGRDLAAAPLLPEDVPRLTPDQVWRLQVVSLCNEPQCLLCQRFSDEPLDRDARIDHEAPQRSRSSRIRSLLSLVT